MMNDLTSMLIAGVLVVGAFTGTYFYGKSVVQKEWDIATAKTEAEIEMLKEQASRITTQTEIKYVDRIKVVKEKGETIVQYIPQYITKTDDSNCTINDGAIWVLDAAIKNSVPRPPNETDRAPSGIDLSSLVENTAQNYTICLQYKERALAWEQWAKDQKELNK